VEVAATELDAEEEATSVVGATVIVAVTDFVVPALVLVNTTTLVVGAVVVVEGSTMTEFTEVEVIVAV
jgi:hypothetical protein